MADLFPVPLDTVLSATSAALAPGAQVRVRTVDTDTDVPWAATPTSTTDAAIPAVADQYGRIPPRWVPAGSYKLVIASTGATTREIPIAPGVAGALAPSLAGSVVGPAAVYDLFAGKPDGHPGTAKTGQSWLTTGANLPVVKSGRLAPTSPTPGAGYACLPLGGPGELIGFVVRFGTGSAPGDTATLAFFSNPGVILPGDCPLHINLSAIGWSIQNFPTNGGPLNIIRSGNNDLPAKVDQDVRFAAMLDHDAGAIHLLLPDDSVHTVFDPSIRDANPATYACWEFGSNPNITISEVFAEPKGGGSMKASAAAASARALISSTSKLKGTGGTQYQRPPSTRGGARHVDSTLGKTLFPSPTGWVDANGARAGNLLAPNAATAIADPATSAGWLSGSGGSVALKRGSGIRGRDNVFELTSTAAGSATCYTGTTFPAAAGDIVDSLIKRLIAVGTPRNFRVLIYWSTGANAAGPSTATGTIGSSKTLGSRFSATAPSGATSAFIALSVDGCAAAGEKFQFTETCAVKTATPLTEYVEA